MELYKQGRRQPRPSPEQLREQGLVRRAAEMPVLTDRQRAIVARYGPSEAVLAAFRPEMVHEYSQDYEKRLERPLPTLATLRNCYPEAPGLTLALMLNLVNGTVVALGEEQRVDEKDRLSIARGLCGNTRFRRLSMTSILQFFFRLQTGEIESEGWLRPAKFLKLANTWALQAGEAERRAAIERERRAWKSEEEARAGQPTFAERWEAKKRELGLDPELTWAAWQTRQGEQARQARMSGQRPPEPQSNKQNE